MIDLSYRVARSSFFDRSKVMGAIDRATLQALRKAGAFIRTAARSSMRRRKAVSRPGHPPSAHEGGLKRLLFFAWDASRRSTVVGPVRYRDGKAPPLLEFGGSTVGNRGEPRQYRPRPFMRPAMLRELSRLPKRWRNSISS